MTTHTIRFAAGRISAIYDDKLQPALSAVLGNSLATAVKRGSHVEPDGNGGWSADMSPVHGPVLTGFKLRCDALAAEVKYLRNRLKLAI